MKKIFLAILLAATLCHADPLSFPHFYATTDTLTAAKENANNNAAKNWGNGNIADDNIKAGAAIAQSKIDSSDGGWISQKTSYTSVGSQFVNFRSPYGMGLYINDSTTYDKEFLFVSDSTDSIAVFDNDSVVFYKPMDIQSMVKVDTVVGPTYVDTIWSDSIGAGVIDADSIGADSVGAGIVRAATVYANNVGVGTTPAYLIHGITATPGSVTPNSGADELVLENNGACGITVASSDAQTQNLYFGCPTDVDVFKIISSYNGGSQFAKFYAGNRLNLTTTTDSFAVNPSGADVDFSISADTVPNMVVVDGALGKVGIGTAAPGYRLSIHADEANSVVYIHNDGNNANRYGVTIDAGADDQSATTNYFVVCRDGDGGDVGYLQNASGTFTAADVSDRRVKEEIEDAGSTVDLIKRVKIRNYKYKRKSDKGPDDRPTTTGVIAQELLEVIPNAVVYNPKSDRYAYSPASLVPYLIKAVQEQQEMIEDLQERVTALEK